MMQMLERLHYGMQSKALTGICLLSRGLAVNAIPTALPITYTCYR